MDIRRIYELMEIGHSFILNILFTIDYKLSQNHTLKQGSDKDILSHMQGYEIDSSVLKNLGQTDQGSESCSAHGLLQGSQLPGLLLNPKCVP